MMKWKDADLQSRLYMIAAIILLLGLGSSALIFLTANVDSDDMSMYEFEHSKMYRHDLELYGGKINVLASDFMRWFQGLWHGRSLAVTVACITFIISAVIIFIAYHAPSEPDTDSGDENTPDPAKRR
jgi:hypothetical protein